MQGDGTGPGNGRVLVVEDDDVAQARLVRVLREGDARVHVAGPAAWWPEGDVEVVVAGAGLWGGRFPAVVERLARLGDRRPHVIRVGGDGRDAAAGPPVDDVVGVSDLAAALVPRVRMGRTTRAARLECMTEAARARRERDRAASLVSALQDGLAVVDEDGVLVEVNDRLCEMTGFTREELISSRAPFPYWPQEEAERIAALLGELAAGRRTGDVDLVMCRKDGHRFPAVITSSPMRDMDGRTVGRVTTFKDMTARMVAQAEQDSLRRMAMEVAAGVNPDRVFVLVAREAAGLFAVDSAMVVRFEGDHATVVGTFGEHSTLGERLPTVGNGVLARVARTGGPAWIDDYSTLEASSPLRAHALAYGYRASAAAPVMVGGALWGAVLVTTKDDRGLAAGAGDRLARFAELVALAVDNAQTHAELQRLAATDPLTRLANRRAFEERLEQEVARARRHDRELSLVVLDLDHFKRVNDSLGHPAGDRVLVEFAERVRRHVRPEDFVARMGGEEFAWLMPECSALEALRAAERLRSQVVGAPFGDGVSLTLSGGVCELSQAGGAAELYRLADEALFWAKGHGRNQVWRYSEALSDSLGTLADEARIIERRQTVRGVRALARAVDAKDPATRRHSERVADLSVRIAERAGWDSHRVVALGEAALIHDVGKIGVVDAVLLKPGPLSPEEFEAVKTHAALGAEIAGEVLTPEQAAWVRHHHERWDGTGYPDRLDAAEIPDGALVIAVADAVDVMCSARVYAPARSLDEALAEVRRQAGLQFAPWVVEALEQLAREGELLRDEVAQA